MDKPIIDNHIIDNPDFCFKDDHYESLCELIDEDDRYERKQESK